MIKGVNKQIIEISQTGNRYFERALLFVRTEYMQLDNQKLKDEATRLIAELGPPPKTGNPLTRPERMRLRESQKRKKMLRTAILTLCFTALGLVIFFLGRALS